jgi:hypothetical protein
MTKATGNRGLSYQPRENRVESPERVAEYRELIFAAGRQFITPESAYNYNGIDKMAEKAGIGYPTMKQRLVGRVRISNEMMAAAQLWADQVDGEITMNPKLPHDRTLSRSHLLLLLPPVDSFSFEMVVGLVRYDGFKTTERAIHASLSRLVEDGNVDKLARGYYQTRPRKRCSMPQCDKRSHARGLCRNHWIMMHRADSLHLFPTQAER